MLDKLKINRKLLRELDFSILIIVLIISIFGALNIYSATHMKFGISFFTSQLKWIVLGTIVMYFILVFDYSLIQGYANIIYWFGVILLFLNDTIFKSTVNGAGSWMKIGSTTIGQPSEFAKLGMIIMLAKKLDEMEGNINSIKNFFILAMYAAIPMILIVIQPDMGMMMVCFFIVLGIFFAAGLNLKVICGGFAAIIGAIAIVWNSPLMQNYWKVRLISFLDPEADELGAGLQLLQSQIGIGSGGILGKGFLKGTQVAGGFIPESHTDFIFAVVGEEWGTLGAIFLLALYGILIYKFINIAKTSKDIFGSMISVGVVSTFLFSIYQNIGMAVGAAPITGITLPLMSYGGSSFITAIMSIGLVVNVGMRRKKINF
ncbi:rod shape-determining protein RodA [Clostridium tetanomorphum]|uniref:Peptidoglycan glycosyltransferase RodA n=1 Tax=Clostridium tetanomorphum TaxID=1553 RepID=A0A923E6F0_CLOTT|nr:rod shape-determining protein RodA [Clostridium tetanomorphum]MBC2397320.1 rod shape-determining protein RodA [Clostridium tetanomorphum]NRZ96369.1 rod shape determining protein RodA [Clostridium tetanomorphum]